MVNMKNVVESLLKKVNIQFVVQVKELRVKHLELLKKFQKKV